MNGILRNRLDEWLRSRRKELDAILDLERAVLALQQMILGGPEPIEVGPFAIPKGQPIQAGSTAFIVRGSLHLATVRGEWMGEHGIGVVSGVSGGKAKVIMTGKARVNVTSNSRNMRLNGGERLFVSASPGALASGWPPSGTHVYPVAHVIGNHKGYMADVWVNPQTGMRFG